MEIKIRKTDENAITPIREDLHVPIYNLYARIPFFAKNIKPGKSIKIGTGIAIELPDGYYGEIFVPDKIFETKGLRFGNGVTLVRDNEEIAMTLYNDSNDTRTVYDEEVIGQLIIKKFEDVTMVE